MPPEDPAQKAPPVSYPIPERRPETLRERAYFPELLRGLAVSTRHFLRNLLFTRDSSPDVLHRRGPNLVSTVQYPEEVAPYPPGYRGMHRLVPREDGQPRCVACYLCATICPAQCIYIEAGEVPNDPIEKRPVRFEIDELRCIVCGFCVEACPKDAIRMDTGTHCKPTYDRPSIIYGIDRLLKGPAVSHQSDVWFKRESSEPPPAPHPFPIPPESGGK
ncbi:MAG: NuoI/complex I 23 kDa subunit family protein [Myxococcales bacterium]